MIRLASFVFLLTCGGRCNIDFFVDSADFAQSLCCVVSRSVSLSIFDPIAVLLATSAA